MSDAELAGARVRQLLDLTRRLTERLAAETRAFQEGRPQEVAKGLAETQEMANLYRRDSAHVKANPALLADAPSADRSALIEATRAFDRVSIAKLGHAKAMGDGRAVAFNRKA